MNAGMMLRSGLFAVACGVVFASPAAFSEPAQDAAPAATEKAPPAAAAKPADKKPQSGGQPANADTKPKRGQYATEAEARSHCKGEVVWVDKDNFNHYRGSREYGRQPGAFSCEKG
jgi:hypothetical protein